MASNLQFVQFVADILYSAGEITYRKMFGEYGVYCDGKIFALICDNQLFVKITDIGKTLAPDLKTASPYDGAKPYFLIENIEDKEFLVPFVEATCRELPEPKPKKNKNKK